MNKYPPKNIEYSEYYVAFLDILGFKNLVFSNRPADKDKIQKYFGLIESVTEKLKLIKSKKNLGSIIISDSVILSVPAEGTTTNKLDKLRNLCVAVAKIQLELAMNDIWLRGAISSGKAYFDSERNNVVGKAYINSYLLEERQAIYPRVILDNKIINELKKGSAQNLIDKVNDKNNQEYKFTNWQTDILYSWEKKALLTKSLKQDLALFVDYLSPVIFDTKMFEKVAKNIQQNIYSGNNIYPKFRWVLNYLIACCEWKVNGAVGGYDKELKKELLKLKKF